MAAALALERRGRTKARYLSCMLKTGALVFAKVNLEVVLELMADAGQKNP